MSLLDDLIDRVDVPDHTYTTIANALKRQMMLTHATKKITTLIGVCFVCFNLVKNHNGTLFFHLIEIL